MKVEDGPLYQHKLPVGQHHNLSHKIGVAIVDAIQEAAADDFFIVVEWGGPALDSSPNLESLRRKSDIQSQCPVEIMSSPCLLNGLWLYSDANSRGIM